MLLKVMNLNTNEVRINLWIRYIYKLKVPRNIYIVTLLLFSPQVHFFQHSVKLGRFLNAIFALQSGNHENISVVKVWKPTPSITQN